MRKLISATVIALGLGFAPTLVPSAIAQTDDKLYEQLDIFTRVLERIRREYVDEVDDTKVIEAAIQGMLKSLDPHSTYLNPEVFEQVQTQMEGRYGGLGIEVQMKDGVILVVSPIDDTPAAKAGIMGGDYITHIDGNAILGKSLTEAVNSMRGPVGEPITITVVRKEYDSPFDVDLVREHILIRAVVHRIEEETIGYIRVATFNKQSGREVEKAIEALKSDLDDEMDGLILDLRSNPGGLLSEAIRISDAFLDRGEIVSTRGRRSNNNNRWYATQGDMLDGLPIVVLVNASSASASEIVAGALKDHRRAILLGDTTFGKGTVQSEIELGRGDQAIRLTTARYYTPSGQSIQERGVEPDIELLIPRDPRRPVRREADLLNHIANEQSADEFVGETTQTETPRDIKDKTTQAEASTADNKPREQVDTQLKHAIKLLKDMAHLPAQKVASAGR